MAVAVNRFRQNLFPDAASLFFVADPKEPSSWTLLTSGKDGRSSGKVMNSLAYSFQLARYGRNLSASHVIVVSGSSDAEKSDLEYAAEQFRAYGLASGLSILDRSAVSF